MLPDASRGKLSRANPPAEIVFLTDGLPRTQGLGIGFIAWAPGPLGRVTLADCYTDGNQTGSGGQFTEFDPFRHPHFRMNSIFSDGHVESLIMNVQDLQHGVLISK